MSVHWKKPSGKISSIADKPGKEKEKIQKSVITEEQLEDVTPSEDQSEI